MKSTPTKTSRGPSGVSSKTGSHHKPTDTPANSPPAFVAPTRKTGPVGGSPNYTRATGRDTPGKGLANRSGVGTGSK